MKKVTIAAAIVAGATLANAQTPLTIDVVGTPGAGITTWTFSGFGSTNTAGTLRDNTGNTFNAGDTGQFPFSGDTILNVGYQNMVFVLTGSVSITIGSVTENLSGIFLDDDGASADDLGVRAANPVTYALGEATSWTGSGTVNVDINDFALGPWSINSADGQAMFLNDPVLVNFAIVPEPATFVVLGAGALALLLRRRR